MCNIENQLEIVHYISIVYRILISNYSFLWSVMYYPNIKLHHCQFFEETSASVGAKKYERPVLISPQYES